ncbi:MAG: response regulator [Candidatus Bathyarchaeota archaeon]|jgi:DNA-binding response OmpR family regulator
MSLRFMMESDHVLLVEDDEDQLVSFERILVSAGYSVEKASTGMEALRLVGEGQFGLAILDVKLPDIQGDEVAARLRARDDTVPIIFITGYPSLQESIEALDLGIQEILLKPIEPEELIRAARDALPALGAT